MMHQLVIVYLFQVLFCQEQPQLYNLKEADIQAEFSNPEAKKAVEDDIRAFDSLARYEDKNINDIDLKNQLAGIEITQQLLRQADNHGAASFLKMPNELYSQGSVQNLGHINFEQFYDYETNSYLQQFVTPEAFKSMKKIHMDYFTKQINQQKQPDSFIQKQESRPKELPVDFNSSFMSIQNKNKIYPLQHLWQKLENKNCWASSRYEFSYVQILWSELPKMKYDTQGVPYHTFVKNSWQELQSVFNGYPCSTHVSDHKWWYWFSEKIPVQHQNKEVSFRLEFDTIQRVRFIQVIFMIAPREVKLETSQDLEYWETLKDYLSTPEWWKFQWYPYEQHFDPMVYSRGIKIIMKGFLPSHHGERQGIWQINTFSQQQTVMIMEKVSIGIPQCLSRAESSYNMDNKPHILMNCYDAVLQNDGREIYFLDKLNIKQWADWSCIFPQKPKGDKPQYIVSSTCQNEDDFIWIINRLGKIESKKYSGKCLAAQSDSKIEQIQQYGFVTVSSTISDSRANPYNPIDPNGYGFWAPPMDVAHAFYEIMFDRTYTVEKINIKWKLKPPKFEIMIFTSSQKWKVILSEEPKDDIELVQVPTEIKGIKIVMMNLKEKTSDTREGFDPIYGIKKIEVFRPGTSTSLQTCGPQNGESKIMNRWKVEQVEYINIAYKIPYEMAENYMEDQYSDSVGNIRTFMLKVTQFGQVLTRAQRIRDVISQMQNKFSNVIESLNNLRKDVDKNDVNPEQDSSAQVYAGSPETAATDCGKIKQNADYKQGGYYWVRAKCMPRAARVYCDIDDNFPNFYIYYGYQKEHRQELDQVQNVEGVQIACGKLGLQPVEISTTSQYEHILSYLNESGANAKDDFVIPIAYKWDQTEKAKFRSFNKNGSPILEDKLEKYIDRSKITMSSFQDALVLKSSSSMLTPVQLSQQKIRGVVCSENKLPLGPSESDEIQIKCLDMIDNVKSDWAVGETIKLVCPKGCQSSTKGNVSKMKEKFTDDSSICRAALFEGLAKDTESSTFKIKFVNIIGFLPDAGENNNIALSERHKTNNKGFQFDIKTIEEECPNLQEKKSFISFNEILNKFQTQNKTSQSFIESDEQIAIKDASQNKNKENEQNYIKLQQKSYKDDVSESQEISGDGGPTSQKALSYIRTQLKKKLFITDHYLKYVGDSKILIEQQTKAMKGVYDSDLNPKFQRKLIEKLDVTLKQIQQDSQKLMERASNQLKKSEENLNYEIEQYLILKRFAPHEDVYKFINKIETLYDIRDYNDMQLKSVWKYTTTNVAPHKSAINQVPKVTCGDNLKNPSSECTATQLEIKHKIFYDFKISFNYKVQDVQQGWIGIIFRKKDDFNYYCLDINKSWVRYRRMYNGKQSIISFDALPFNHLSNIWYNLELSIVQSQFVTKIIQEDSAGKNLILNAKIVLKGDDLYIKSGKIALTTDNALDTYFDSFKVEPLPCYVDPFDPETAVKYLVDTNRFRDKYRSDISLIWKQPEDSENLVIYKQNYFGKKTVIFHKTNKNQTNKACQLIDKVFDTGTIGFQTLFEDYDSEYNIKFFYQNFQNQIKVYINAKQIQILNVIDGKSNVLRVVQKDLKLSMWHQLYFDVSSSNFMLQIMNDKTKKIENLLDSPISRNGSMLGGNIVLKPKKGTMAIDDFFLDPLDSTTFLKDQVDTVTEKEDEEDLDREVDSKAIEESFVQTSETIVNQIPETKINQTSETKVNKTNNVTNKNQSKNKKFDYQICLEMRTPIERQGYCSQKFPAELEATDLCTKKFCAFCCQDKFPNNLFSETKICEKECQKQEKADIVTEFKQCVESDDPIHSLFYFCNQDYQEKQDIWLQTYCKRDLCQACCVSMPINIDSNIDEKQIIRCQDKCKNQYR